VGGVGADGGGPWGGGEGAVGGAGGHGGDRRERRPLHRGGAPAVAVALPWQGERGERGEGVGGDRANRSGQPRPGEGQVLGENEGKKIVGPKNGRLIMKLFPGIIVKISPRHIPTVLIHQVPDPPPDPWHAPASEGSRPSRRSCRRWISASSPSRSAAHSLGRQRADTPKHTPHPHQPTHTLNGAWCGPMLSMCVGV